MMNLEEFVTETLKQIINGVSNAQDHAKNKGAYINAPIMVYAGPEIRYYSETLPTPQDVEFDIAVTTTESKDIKGGMGIFVASFGVGYKGTKGTSGSEVSRIRFSIPIILPSQPEN